MHISIVCPTPTARDKGGGGAGLQGYFDARFLPGGWGVQLIKRYRHCTLFLRMCNRAVLPYYVRFSDVKTVVVILDRNDKRKRNRRVSLSGSKKEFVEATRRVDLLSDILAP